jgi:hypothetical protein
VIDADGQIIGQVVLSEEERTLAEQVATLNMAPNQYERSGEESRGRDTTEPIIQFPDEEGQNMGVEEARVSMSKDKMAHVCSAFSTQWDSCLVLCPECRHPMQAI